MRQKRLVALADGRPLPGAVLFGAVLGREDRQEAAGPEHPEPLQAGRPFRPAHAVDGHDRLANRAQRRQPEVGQAQVAHGNTPGDTA